MMTIIDDLERAGLLPAGPQTQTKVCVEGIYGDILTKEIISPSAFLSELWGRYQNSQYQNRDMNGRIFEVLLSVILYRSGIRPLYQQVSVSFVPNVNFDLIANTQDHGIISISAKTSLRERWKQADLEAFALKSVHRQAKCYLITLNAREARSVNEKIASGGALGLDQVVLANTAEFDAMIANLQNFTFTTAGNIPILEHVALSAS